jgi:hypothetical protein
LKGSLVKGMSQWTNRFHVLQDLETPQNEFVQSSQSQSEIQTMPKVPPPYAQKIYIRSINTKLSTQIEVQIKTLDTGLKLAIKALLDSGATGLFLDTNFVKENHLNTRKLSRPIPVYNVDGTLNQGGSIQEEIDMIMHFKDHSEKATFAICDLGDKTAIIGHTRLYHHNPEIDW